MSKNNNSDNTNDRLSTDANASSYERPDASKPLPSSSSPSSSSSKEPPPKSPFYNVAALAQSRTSEAARQLFCGGIAGAVAKTITAPFSRLTILFQVHSMVTTKEHRPKFAMSLQGGFGKMIERGGIFSLWKGNMTSVLHRFPYSAINFYIYENALDFLSQGKRQQRQAYQREDDDRVETHGQLVRRMSKMVMTVDEEDDDEYEPHHATTSRPDRRNSSHRTSTTTKRTRSSSSRDETPAIHKFLAGASAGTVACLACYPLDLVRTRLTTELEGREHYKGIVDCFTKIGKSEGLLGFYSGVGPTLLVAVPNFAISYTVYGSLKEYTLDDELFYNLRRIDADSGEPKMGLILTVLCGATSGALATLVTFPMDTIRRRMQIQSLHIAPEHRVSAPRQFYELVTKEGLSSVYRGLTPELIKVIPMVSSMFFVYEWSKELLNVRQGGR